MSHPFDTCRLYFSLRNRAWRGAEPPGGGEGRGVVDLDAEAGEDLDEQVLEDLGAHGTMESLLEANLVHWVTPDEECQLGLSHPPDEHHRLFVEPLDDLAAATILMTRS